MSKGDVSDAATAIGTATSLGILLLVIFCFQFAWFIMLGLGAAHSVWPVIPATGYWATYGMTLALGTLAKVLR